MINTTNESSSFGLILFFLSVAAIGGVVIPIILYGIIGSIHVFSIFYMALTIVLILLSPLVFTFKKWDESIVGQTEAKTLLQIDATVIVGILFFLSLSPVQITNSPLQITNSSSLNEEIDKNAKNSEIMHPKIIITILTALTLIPFALSAIIIAIWGGEKFWEEQEMTKKLNPHHATGTQIGTAFMIAGFFWIIITMLMLVFIIPYPEYWGKMI